MDKFALLWIQIGAVWLATVAQYRYLGRLHRRPPIHDFGILWLVVFSLYNTLPVVAWIVSGGEYPIYFGNLWLLAPSADDQAALLNIVLAYALAFCVGQRLVVGGHPLARTVPLPTIPYAVVAASAAIVASYFLLDLVLRTSGMLRSASSYADQYLATSELPTGVRQIYNLTYGLSNFCIGVLVIDVIKDLRRHRWLLIAYVLILFLSYDVAGSRAGIATALFRVAIVWHVVRKPFPNRFIILAAVVGVTVFNVLGYLRGLRGGGDAQLTVWVGEFLEIWANAVHLQQIGQSQSFDLPWMVRFGEFFSFIPSQLLGDAKNSLDNWFAQTYYTSYFETGGGLAFGAVSQAVVGGGVAEAVIRGLVLGGLAGAAARWLQGRRPRWWHFPVQVYLAVYMYYSVRSTSFAFLGSIFTIMIPSIVMLTIAQRVFRPRRAVVRAQASHSTPEV